MAEIKDGLKTVARIEISEASKFTEVGVKDIAQWMRYQADSLEHNYKQFADDYSGQYQVFVDDDGLSDGVFIDG